MEEIKYVLKNLGKSKESILNEVKKILKRKQQIILQEHNKECTSYEESVIRYNELIKTYKLYEKILKISK